MSTPGTAPFLIPTPELTDAANVETGFEPMRDRIEAVLAQMLVPVGGLLAYTGSGDPAGGSWLLADGRLIDKTTYADFFTAVGHAYNGGVDPGSNKVRLPDKRGRSSVGADNMGTTQGAASRLPNSNRARGQSGGEERHVLSAGELADHVHNFSGNTVTTLGGGGSSPTASGAGGILTQTGGIYPGPTGQAHNNLQPYEIDNMIVRVA